MVNTHNDKEIGNFKVLCNGRATMPASCAHSFCSYILIVVPSVLAMIFIIPGYASGWDIFIEIIYCLSMIASLAALLTTTCSDPGIIPRSSPYDTQQSFLTKKKANTQVNEEQKEGGSDLENSIDRGTPT